ncbi:MAG: hypothetical protein P4K83_05225 [Terracidiphilus sp.]|nr:hypothetical protein [Terracidiphilus sp.]
MQEQALSACFKEVYNGERKAARLLLPVRSLQFWIETNVLLILKDAPFDKRDAELIPTAGSCADCPKRTGHNKLLFSDDLGKSGDRCTDPKCYNAKVTEYVAKTIAAKPNLVQISTAYGSQKEGSPVLPRNRYTAIRDDKPKSNDEAKRPEFKVCKYATDAIITEGTDVGTVHKVCTNPACPIHHPKKQASAGANDAQWKAEQEKRRREEAIANATGLRVLSAISNAVPVRLMKRDLLFVADRLVNLLDENRAAILARQHGIKKTRVNDSIGKLFTAFLRRADESTLGRAVVEAVVFAHRHARQRCARSARCRRRLQSGCGRNHGHGQNGIRGEGKSQSCEEDSAQTARKGTGQGRQQTHQEGSSITNLKPNSLRSLSD